MDIFEGGIIYLAHLENTHISGVNKKLDLINYDKRKKTLFLIPLNDSVD
jgi:hypothetical protein